MKRFGVALAVAGVVFSGIYGLAASLNVSSGSLGAGNASVAACQSATLTPSYATSYSATLPGYKVGIVTVNGFDSTSTPNCASKAYKITLINGSNTSLGEVTGTTPSSGTSFTADFSSANVSAASVSGVHVVISG
jgi:hypothetical protein